MPNIYFYKFLRKLIELHNVKNVENTAFFKLINRFLNTNECYLDHFKYYYKTLTLSLFRKAISISVSISISFFDLESSHAFKTSIRPFYVLKDTSCEIAMIAFDTILKRCDTLSTIGKWNRSKKKTTDTTRTFDECVIFKILEIISKLNTRLYMYI